MGGCWCFAAAHRVDAGYVTTQQKPNLSRTSPRGSISGNADSAIDGVRLAQMLQEIHTMNALLLESRV